MAAGRPDTYRPEACDRIVELGKRGLSLAQMAAAMDCGRSTFLRWCENHPEFASAYSRAREYAQAYWEDYQVGALTDPNLNESTYKSMMCARFPHDYKDSRRLEIAGTLGTRQDPPVEMTDDQLLEFLAQKRREREQR